jgi:FHS family L-fucose permease-like MFS transporter
MGPTQYAAAHINLAQSCNGIGWIFGPIAGSMFFYSKNDAGQSTGSQTLWIPYAGVAVVVIILAIIFYFSNVPNIKAEDDYHLDDPEPGASRSIWSHPHFVMAVAAQFFYVAAQSGIFAFFINYMTSEPPAIPAAWNSALTSVAAHSGFLHNWLLGWFEVNQNGILAISDKGAANLASLGFMFFLLGRFSGAGLLKTFSAHKILGFYATLNVVATFLIFCKLGWLSVASVFVTYFCMSIMFPTIFALGIFGLGSRAKQASSFIVMAIMGGAILPKFMGSLADQHGLSFSFIIPMVCFAFVAIYAFSWEKLSKLESLHRVACKIKH